MTDYRAIAASIADELQQHPGRWCQCALALDSDGNRTRFDDPEARQWCLIGHMKRRFDSFDLQEQFKDSVGLHSISRFNDATTTTVADVIALCRKVAQS